MQSPLANKVILITGSARRVGAAAARSLHAAGADVMLHYRRAASEAARLCEELNSARPKSAALAQADLLDPQQLEQLAAAPVRTFGRLDVLINNASSFFPTPFGSITLAQWDDLIGTNLRAPMFLAQATGSDLRASGGCIVNITDIHADRPLERYSVYSVAKAGLTGLTRALAVEMAPQVRVNGIAPGPILWPEQDPVFDTLERARVIGQTLLARVGSPEDIARTALFLIAEAPYVTGQIFTIDGGRSVAL
jgi:pteridine reductase